MGGVFSSISNTATTHGPKGQQNKISPIELTLAAAESIDGYRQAISQSPINRKAREGQIYAPAPSFIAPVGSISSPPPWPTGTIIWMMPSADGGLPHTRGNNIICIPAYYPVEQLPSLLLHERVHLHQKMYKERWDKFFTERWLNRAIWTLPPNKWSDLIRLNPDTIGTPYYAWKHRYVPLTIFDRKDRPDIRETTVIWLDLVDNTVAKYCPPEWDTWAGTTGPSTEHPREMAAYYIQDRAKWTGTPAADILFAALDRGEFHLMIHQI